MNLKNLTSMLVITVFLFIQTSCSSQTCDNLSDEFSSYANATQKIKSASYIIENYFYNDSWTKILVL